MADAVDLHSGFTLSPDANINLGESGKIVGLLNVDQNTDYAIKTGAVSATVFSVPDLSSNIEVNDILKVEIHFYASFDAASSGYLTVITGSGLTELDQPTIPQDGNLYYGSCEWQFRYEGGGTFAYISNHNWLAVSGNNSAIHDKIYGHSIAAWDMVDFSDWLCSFKYIGNHASDSFRVNMAHYTLIKSDA